MTVPLASAPKLDPAEEHFRIPSHHEGLSLFLRYLPPTAARSGAGVVLYVHGATFPSALSIAHRFDGRSWRDELADAGFHVWGLDFHGYGLSDLYPAMADCPAVALRSAAPRTPRRRSNGPCVSLSRTMACPPSPSSRIPGARSPPACSRRAAPGWSSASCSSARLPDASRKDRHPLCQPGCRLRSKRSGSASSEDVRRASRPCRPGRHSMSGRHSTSRPTRGAGHAPRRRSQRRPAPRPISRRSWHGDLPYDPAAVKAPVAIIRGEWDLLVTDADARWLFDSLRASPLRRDVKISRATHLMHLEAARFALYREAEAFLLARDVEPETAA